MAKFNVGDKVVAVRSNLSWEPKYAYKKGDTFLVTKADAHHTCFEGRGEFTYEADNFELVEDTSSYHPHHDVIVAWAKGAKIEYRITNTSCWEECEGAKSPGWFSWCQYRVAPEKTKKELEIERIESEMRKLADDLNKLKGV